ncbi:hypothetical protein STEG23_032442 [Scotinomys teguina]
MLEDGKCYLKDWQSNKPNTAAQTARGTVSLDGIGRMDDLNIGGSRNKENHYYLQCNSHTQSVWILSCRKTMLQVDAISGDAIGGP